MKARHHSRRPRCSARARLAVAYLVLLALSAFASNTARAEEEAPSGPIVGILSIQSSGVSETTANEFRSQILLALEGQGLNLVLESDLRKRLVGSDYIVGCFFGPCLAALRAAAGVPLVLVARIVGEGSNFRYVISLVDTKSGVFTAQVADSCLVCPVEEATSSVNLLTIEMLTSTNDGTLTLEQSTNRQRATSRHASLLARKKLRRASWALIGVGVAVGITGSILWHANDHEWAVGGFSAGAALIGGGTSLLLFSGHF